jgi:hypothetical protein
VNLGQDDVAGSHFYGVPNTLSMVSVPTWDTWPFYYEQDGIDQDGSGVADQGTNGIDDNGQGGVDDPTERETSPPYPYPLRGLQVRIRVIEPDTKQVRQATVLADFVPG